MKYFAWFAAIIGIFIGGPLLIMTSDKQPARIKTCLRLCSQAEEPMIYTNSAGIRCKCDNGKSYFITGEDEYTETTRNRFFK